MTDKPVIHIRYPKDCSRADRDWLQGVCDGWCARAGCYFGSSEPIDGPAGSFAMEFDGQARLAELAGIELHFQPAIEVLLSKMLNELRPVRTVEG